MRLNNVLLAHDNRFIRALFVQGPGRLLFNENCILLSRLFHCAMNNDSNVWSHNESMAVLWKSINIRH